jgi:hypothetical protein
MIAFVGTAALFKRFREFMLRDAVLAVFFCINNAPGLPADFIFGIT